VADVNGDGRLDLVTSNFKSNNVSVLLGNGNGTFGTAKNFALGTAPSDVAVADVNGDGRLDLVVTDYSSNQVGVLLGNGNGTFKAAVNFGVGSGPFAVAVADLNQDGVPDLAVANDGSSSVSVLLGIRNAATHFQVKAPANATAGTSFTITVNAFTAGNQLDAVYTGTIHFMCTDGAAVLPADYTFTLRDSGSHTFTVTLNTDGNQTITVTDTATGLITGSAVVSVTGPAPPPASRSGRAGNEVVPDTAGASTIFHTTATPSPTGGTAVRSPVTAVDEFDSMVASYWSTASLSSSGAAASLPASYTFVNTDDGRHTFPMTAMAPQSQGTATVAVNATEWPPRGRQLIEPDVDGLNPGRVEAFFAQYES
jgi:hypothetical protein